jgi:multiple sugar transport system ATP-binding protein
MRPEDLHEAGRPARGATAALSLAVELVEPLGHEVVLYGRSGQDLLVAKLGPAGRLPELGSRIEVSVELDGLHLFDAASEERLAGG